MRAIAFAEGRIVETLLGERMPRRPVAGEPEGSFWARIKHWLTDARTWLTMLYMVLQLPLGILYFTLFTILLAFVMGFFASPFLQVVFGLPAFTFGETEIFLSAWAFPLMWLVSFALLLATLHLARLVGRFHAMVAKSMLARG